MERTIQDVFNLETGKWLKANDLLNTSEKEIYELRRELEIGIQKNDSKVVCAICHQPIKLRAGAGFKRILHFAHLRDSETCPIKTNTKYSKDEWLRIIYNGAKESKKHKDMKERMEKVLTDDERFGKPEIEKTIKDINKKSKWRKPDIQCKYNNMPIAFEMQISHTFLSVIVERDIFYISNGIPLYWICDSFVPDSDDMKVLHRDIFYHHNCNLIVFDDEAYSYSINNKRLTFKVHWLEPRINNKIIYDNWCQDLVDFADIKYDEKTKKIFYYDYERNEKIARFKIKKEMVFDTIRNLDNEHSTNKGREAFENEISSMREFNLEVWNDNKDITVLFFLFNMFLSIRENKCYGYNFKNMKGLLNLFHITDDRKELGWLLVEFLENGNYKGKNEPMFLKQKKDYLSGEYKKNNKYTEFLHYFFNEIKWEKQK